MDIDRGIAVGIDIDSRTVNKTGNGRRKGIRKERQQLPNDRPYYALSVWDHFMPSFCSGSKFYFGTLSQIGDFIGRLKTRKEEMFQGTIAAFNAYLKGDTQACHTIACHNELLLRPAELLAYRESTIGPQEWTFWNIWHHPYAMRLTRARLKQAVFQMENIFYRCISASMKGLAYAFPPNEYHEVTHLAMEFWGNPGFLRIETDGKTVSSTLYTVEQYYESRHKALKDFASGKFSLNGMCEEIFGDD